MPLAPEILRRIALDEGDITRLAVDAAGPGLLAECRGLGGCPPGEARLTAGHRLPARHVIHTVGPVWRGGGAGEAETLARCYDACLGIAGERRFRDIAFPAIATGAYGFPREPAARIAIGAATAHLARRDFPQRVIFVCFDAVALAAYRAAIAAG